MQIFFILNLGKKSRTLENIFKKKEFYLEKDQELKDLKNYCRFSLGSIPQIKKVLKVIKYVSR